MNSTKVKIQIEQAEIELTADQILKAATALPNHERAWLKIQLGLGDRPYPNVIKLREEGQTPAEQLKLQMTESGYKGVNWQIIDDAVQKLNIQEPIEELLKDLD